MGQYQTGMQVVWLYRFCFDEHKAWRSSPKSLAYKALLPGPLRFGKPTPKFSAVPVALALPLLLVYA